MSDSKEKTVTIVDLNGDKEHLSITEDGRISIEGDWLVVYYEEDSALAGFQAYHVKSWWISL